MIFYHLLRPFYILLDLSLRFYVLIISAFFCLKSKYYLIFFIDIFCFSNTFFCDKINLSYLNL